MSKEIFLTLAGAAALCAGSCATQSEVREISSKASEVLAKYDTTGESLTCISLRRLRSIRVLEDQLILVELSGGNLYLNQPATPCGGATGVSRHLEYSTSTSTLCKGELVRVVENSVDTFVGSCVLGDFQQLAEKTAEA